MKKSPITFNGEFVLLWVPFALNIIVLAPLIGFLIGMPIFYDRKRARETTTRHSRG